MNATTSRPDNGAPGRADGFTDRHLRIAVPAVLTLLVAGAAAVARAYLDVEPVAYLFVGVCLVALLGTQILTHLPNERHAAIGLVAFWGGLLVGLYVLFAAYV